MSTLDIKAHDRMYQALPCHALGETLGTKLTHYINLFIHTEEKRQIGLELQEARMKLAIKEKEQCEQCRRELAETHRELIRKF